MGALITKMKEPIGNAAGSVTEIITGRKRKRDDDDYESSDEANSFLERSLNTPKKKKLVSTAQYIYQALFKEERNSDIAVMALGKVWKLHKIYLCQSRYFSSMFGGAWRESLQDFVNIEICDPKITVKALNSVFGSLYLDEVILEPLDIISILATATHFQLEGLIEKCADVMIETLNIETAVKYYEAAYQYGVQNVKQSSFDWLLVNLLSFVAKNSKYLRPISVDLMHQLVSSSRLYVMQTEFALYIALRFWVYVKLHPNVDGNLDKMTFDPDPRTYFSERKDKTPFLLSSQGRNLAKPYRALRLQHLLNHHIDLKILKTDNIVPPEWLNEHLYQQWNHMLQIDQSLEKGPKECDESLFDETCVRCGRILQEEGFQKWRWTGFNYGLDLVLISDTRSLSIKRHHRTENERLLSLQVKRQFLIRTTVASLNELRQVKHTQTTGIKSICLDRNEESLLLVMDKELTYPLQISVNMLVVTPNKPKTETVTAQNSKISKPPTTCLGGCQENDDVDDCVADPQPNRSSSLLNCGSSSCTDGGFLQ